MKASNGGGAGGGMAENGGKPSAAGAGAGAAYTIDLENFTKRLKTLYSHWNGNTSTPWGSSTAFTVATPPASDDLRYLKSSALHIWLLGYEFPETVVVFRRRHIHFLCSQKKVSLLQVLKQSAKGSVGVDIVMHVKLKNEDGKSQMDSILTAVAEDDSSPVIGHLVRENPEGTLLEAWAERLKASGFSLSDITNGLSDIFAVKDGGELTNVKKAAFLTASVVKKFVVPRMENIIDEEKKVAHSSLMDETEKVILEPAKIKVKLKADNVDICYPPILQSGGGFDLKPSAVSNDENLHYDPASVIICAVGSRYNSYCSNVARTYLIDATKAQTRAYTLLLKAHEQAIGALRAGNKASMAYEAAAAAVRSEAPDLVENLTKSVGTGIGLEFRESGLALNSKNERVVREGMVFNVSVGLHNIRGEEKKGKGGGGGEFSLLIADTVVVTGGGEKAEVVTGGCSKAVADVSYSFNEGSEEEAEEGGGVVRAVPSKATLRSEKQEVSKEEARRLHQAELARQKNEETARRLAGGSGAGDGESAAKQQSEMVAYRNVGEVPQPRELVIFIDQKKEAVLIPIYGTMVPFHVGAVRTVSSQQDTNNNCYVRIIFNVPGTPFTPHDSNTVKHQGSIYLKEVSFRSKDPRHIGEVVQQIKTLRRNVMARESERVERSTLVTQEKLLLAGTKFKPIRLSDLWIRPVFGGRGRKMPGTLEAHVNGLRYSTNRQEERVEVMYRNIKHAIFQAAEKEMITLLHFHLHNHIMVGTKKTKDVQFYVEVMDVVQTLGGSRRSAYDPDEIEEEQRERDRKNKINSDFRAFVGRVHDIWSQPPFHSLDLEFDHPLRDLGFHGVPHKASAFLVPASSCLVELIETPFLVLTLSEIEIVNLERVGLGQKNFDMAIVFKDFKRDVFRIDSIPSSSLEGIKEWLNTTDIKYYESRLNLNWRPILKTITEEPQRFIEDGGWEFLNMDASDSDSEGLDDSDGKYAPSVCSEESDSDEEDSDSESLVESEDDTDGSDDDSEEEKGKTWEELEREASNADREKGDDSDSDNDRNRRKKAFAKTRAPPPSASLPKRPKFR